MKVAACIILHEDMLFSQGNLRSRCNAQRNWTTNVPKNPFHRDHISPLDLHKIC